MNHAYLTGLGMTAVGEHWSRSLHELAAQAVSAALVDAGDVRPSMFIVGSAFAGALAGQENLGAFLAARLGLSGVEVHRVEADGASGACALRLAELAVASGAAAHVLVLGIEKMTDLLPSCVVGARARALDGEREAALGLTATASSALLFARYLHEYRQDRGVFGAFARLAHENALSSPHALYRRAVSQADYDRSPAVSLPLCVLDCAPDADGAAAVVVSASPRGKKALRLSSAMASGPLALASRRHFLRLEPAERSVCEVLARSGRTLRDMSLFELDDATSIQAALSLEAAGFADRGHAARLCAEGRFARSAELSINTMGGSKARGNPVGAAGLYRIIEAALQLRGEAGNSQVPRAKVALVQSLGSTGATAVTHVLE